MAKTTRIDYEIAAAKTEVLMTVLLESVRECSAVWNENDMEAIRLIEELFKKIEELHNYFINQA